MFPGARGDFEKAKNQENEASSEKSQKRPGGRRHDARWLYNASHGEEAGGYEKIIVSFGSICLLCGLPHGYAANAKTVKLPINLCLPDPVSVRTPCLTCTIREARKGCLSRQAAILRRACSSLWAH